MTPNDLAQLKQAYKTYLELYDEHEEALIKCAWQLLREIRAKYDTLFATKQYHGQHRWLFCADRVDIGYSDGEFRAEFWERGRCGDNDDLGYVVNVEYLIDPVKMKEYVDKWVESVTNDLNIAAINAKQSRQSQIDTLERQLAKLKSEN